MHELRRLPGRPYLCFVGPMIGRNTGYLKTPGELLSDKFADCGYGVVSVSSSPNRYHRLVDIVRTVIQRRNQIDIMVLQVYGERSFVVEDVASRLGKWFRHRIVMVLHGGTLPVFFKRFPNWAHRVLARADVLVTPSPFLTRTAEAYGFSAQVIPNPLDISIYPYRHRQKARPRMFWMRAFHRWYNPFMAIRVLARLKTKHEDATLTMAGQDKGIEVNVKQLAKQLGVDKAIRFAGFLDVNNKLREGEAADIFLNTNHVDNMPVSILEACAMGLPVVATRVGGIPDLLADGETGLLVADDDCDAMARAVCRILREPGLSARLSANGRKFAESCSWEQVYPLWERLLADVLSGRSSAQPETLLSLNSVSAFEPRRSSLRGR